MPLIVNELLVNPPRSSSNLHRFINIIIIIINTSSESEAGSQIVGTDPSFSNNYLAKPALYWPSFTK